MGDNTYPMGLAQPVDLPELRKPPAPADIGLIDVVAPASQQVGETTGREFMLTAGDGHRLAFGEPGVSVQIICGKRLFEPIQIEFRQRLR